jgi:hypothetical protein
MMRVHPTDYGQAGPLRVHLADPVATEAVHWNPMIGAWLPEAHTAPLCGRATTQELVLADEIEERLWRWPWGFPTCIRCAKALAAEMI